jgi:hypothetical protein
VFLVAFLIPWSALCLVMLTNYRGWLDRYSAFCARSWWARQVTGLTAEDYRGWNRFGAVIGFAIAAFALVAEGIGIANGRIG